WEFPKWTARAYSNASIVSIKPARVSSVEQGSGWRSSGTLLKASAGECGSRGTPPPAAVLSSDCRPSQPVRWLLKPERGEIHERCENRAARKREYPGVQDSRRDAPAHRRKSLDRADPHDRRCDGLRGAHRQTDG